MSCCKTVQAGMIRGRLNTFHSLSAKAKTTLVSLRVHCLSIAPLHRRWGDPGHALPPGSRLQHSSLAGSRSRHSYGNTRKPDEAKWQAQSLKWSGTCRTSMPIKSTLPLLFNHSAHLLGGSQSVHRIHCDAVLVLPSQRLHHEAQESFSIWRHRGRLIPSWTSSGTQQQHDSLQLAVVR